MRGCVLLPAPRSAEEYQAEEQAAAKTFYFHHGNRGVFYGDSITEQAH